MLAGHVDPALHQGVALADFQSQIVQTSQVGGVAGHAGPAEGAAALAEQGTDVGGHKALDLLGLLLGHAGVDALLADAGAVLEGLDTALLELDHGAQLALHGLAGVVHILLTVLAAVDVSLLAGVAGGDVGDGVVAGTHLGDHGGQIVLGQGLLVDVGGVADHADGDGVVLGDVLLGDLPGLVQGVDLHIHVVLGDAAVDDALVSVGQDDHGAVHLAGPGLVAAHAAGTSGQEDLAVHIVVPALLQDDGGQGLEGTLDNALGADVLPRSGGVLGEDGQVLVLQVIEPLPGGLHDVGGGHHNTGGQVVGLEHGHGHAGLDDQSLVVLQVLQRLDDGVVRLPVTGALAVAAVDDQQLGDLGVLHVVLQHAENGLLLPALAAQSLGLIEAAALGLDGEEHLGLAGLGGEHITAVHRHSTVPPFKI